VRETDTKNNSKVPKVLIIQGFFSIPALHLLRPEQPSLLVLKDARAKSPDTM